MQFSSNSMKDRRFGQYWLPTSSLGLFSSVYLSIVHLLLITSLAHYTPFVRKKITVAQFSRCFKNTRNQVSYQLLTGKHATVENDGKVTWTCDVMMNVRCSMDLSDFPYDTQTCTLAFGSSISLDESVHFHISKSLPDSLIGSAQDHVDTSLLDEWLFLGDEVSM